MKRAIIIVLAMGLMASVTFAVDVNLKATFDPNTELDMKEYRLYRLDPTRSLIVTIPHPPTLPYPFVTQGPDGGEVLMSFVLTAVDTANNESGDSNVATYPFDQKPPAAPGALEVERKE